MELVTKLAQFVGIFYNYTGTVTCNDINASANNATAQDGLFWDYLACTEMVMPSSCNGVDDMFWSQPWNFDAYAAQCNQQVSRRSDIISVSVHISPSGASRHVRSGPTLGSEVRSYNCAFMSRTHATQGTAWNPPATSSSATVCLHILCHASLTHSQASLTPGVLAASSTTSRRHWSPSSYRTSGTTLVRITA